MLDMLDIFESFLGSLAVAAVAIPAGAKVAVKFYDRRLRSIQTVLGPYRGGNPVIIRTSVIEASRVEKPDGESHEAKGNLLDSYEIAGAFEIKKYIEGPQWLAGLLESGSRSRDWSALRGPNVTIEIPGLGSRTRSAPPGRIPMHTPMILIGSGVFNDAVRELHGYSEIARIELARDELSDKQKERFRRRQIVLSGNQMPAYGRRDTKRLDKNGDPVYEEYALIQQVKVYHPESKSPCTYLVIAGLGSGGTGAAIQYCIEKWDKLNELSIENPDGFTIVLRWQTSDFSKRPDLADVESLDLSRTDKPKPIRMVKPVGV